MTYLSLYYARFSKALELDDMLAEAHAMMAVLRVHEFDWKGAEREFRRALELDPKSEEISNYYELFYLVPMRRLDEAVVGSRKALELDPLSPFMQWRLGQRYYLARQWDHAIEQFQNALDLDPHYGAAHGYLAFLYIQIGKLAEGIRAFETATQFFGRTPFALGFLGWVHARTGQAGETQKPLEELQKLAQTAYVPPWSFAGVYFALGEIENAFECLEKAVDEGDTFILFLPVDPLYDSLRSHPRYQALLRKMNLEP